MRRKRNKKGYLAVASLMAVATLWMLPIKAEAACTVWTFDVTLDTYCATPICHTGNRTYFMVNRYQRFCMDGVNEYTEYKTATEDHGCCPYN